MAQAIRETADRLGNTVAASRRACIHPGVIRAFRRGAVVAHALRRSQMPIIGCGAGLEPSERALLDLLRRERRSGCPRARGPGPRDTK